ncbi:MAG TPA: DUF169 domain-containing protein [Myxococcales bacterium]|nr:DUF169 domain-containing protein [Myxococcales bacterium]
MTIQQTLKLAMPAVGIAFRDQPPAGVPHAPAGPASCAYWKRAAEGEVFWTDASDHLNCPIGAHTHGAPMTDAKKQELMGLVGTMVQLGYLKMEEVPAIPHRKARLQIAVYGPAEKMPVPADLILVRGTAAQLMVLVEAAQAAGVAPDAPAMGRPTCAALPQALDSARPAVSLGCIGNRVYTGLAEGEGYVAIPAAALARVEEKLVGMARANEELRKFHEARRMG